MEEIKDKYTPKEVAQMYDVDRVTVYRWIKSGQLKAHRTIEENRMRVYIYADDIPRIKAKKKRRSKLEIESDLLTLDE